ncbi:DUF2969 domain-containing protein [Lacticaseibacillus yichunensis]|uniref:DUF2969 domain-containing protein n=1 Tax=Lacticaseibacillus yichunensis TaxID=2486015 RepID=A0ABW4CSC9_9LACO|nr:DUF2969 domain-containing protein [Lacticaseibacillus yichunensis]
MAKEQRISVTEEEVTRNGHTVTVLTVGKNEIGYIQTEEDRFLAYVAGATTAHRFKTMDDATNFLISEYHLHRA